MGLLSGAGWAAFPLVAVLLSSALPQDWRQSVDGAGVVVAGVVVVTLLAGFTVPDPSAAGAGFGVSNPLMLGAAVVVPWLLDCDQELDSGTLRAGFFGTGGFALDDAGAGIVVRLLGYGGKAGIGTCAAGTGAAGPAIDVNAFDGAGTFVAGLGDDTE
jgi:hypothetical protein